MRVPAVAAFLFACTAATAGAQVFINEVLINPPGSLDDTHEYIELLGTPGMKLDGYALVQLFGAQEKLYAMGSIPPVPQPDPEIDELYSLDGLSLGANGLLVIGAGDVMNYDLVLPDSNFMRWDAVFNGGLDTPGKLNNDGSCTILLIRNRPGVTQADPFNPAGLRWGKDIKHDIDFLPAVFDPMDGMLKDQYGDGHIDEGGVSGLMVPKLDLTGTSTPTLLDDLEIVDEVSYEHDRGLEYDTDERMVDLGSALAGLPTRQVHALDDPQGINPDALTRVDYRTKGAGWAPANGAIGALQNGNNWQDTATEQWIRGESIVGSTGVGNLPHVFFDNAANASLDAIQPYFTQVPLWLANGMAPDFDFGTINYQIMPGRLNPLAMPFVPGDADRDGDVDADDVHKIAARFGDDDFIFANGSALAAQGIGTDPALQTRPWDINTNGENGIDPSDLQWALAFQGDTTGQIRGVTYDSTTPSSTGVFLNDGSGVAVTLTAANTVPCGRPLTGLHINDRIEMLVSGEVTGGANLLLGQENGIQQLVHDLLLDTAGVLEVEAVEALGAFSTTRAAIQLPNGTFDKGMLNINAYSLSFTQGLSGAVPLYKLTLKAIGAGSTGVFLGRANKPEFLATTPRGIKVGHTAVNGNPAVVAYPNAFGVVVLNQVGPSLDAYGTGCPGTGGFVPTLRGEGCATPGGSITLRIEHGLPGASSLLFLGFGNGSANLSQFCALQVLPILPSPIVLPPLFGAGAGNGFLTLPGLVIPVTAPANFTLYLQDLYADPGAPVGVSGTNPLKLFIAP